MHGEIGDSGVLSQDVAYRKRLLNGREVKICGWAAAALLATFAAMVNAAAEEAADMAGPLPEISPADGSAGGSLGLLNVDLSGNGASLAASVPYIAIDPHHQSRIYVAWRFVATGGDPLMLTAEHNWECHLSTSADAGAHFDDQVLQWQMPDTPRCNAPYVDVANNGDVYVGATLMAPPVAPRAAEESRTLPFGRAVIAESRDGGRDWLPAMSVIASDSTGRFATNPGIPEEAMRSPWDGARGVIDHNTGDIYVSGGYPASPKGAAHSQRFFTVSSDGLRSFGLIRAYGSAEWPERWDSHIIAANGELAFSYVAAAVPIPGAECPCVAFATSADKGMTLSRHFVAAIKNLDTLVHYPPIAADPNRKGSYALAMVTDDKKRLAILRSADAGAHWQASSLNQPADVVMVSRPALTYSPQSHLLVMWRGYHADGGYDVYIAGLGHRSKFGTPVKWSTASSSVPKELVSHYAVRGDFLNVLAADDHYAHGAWTDWRTGVEARVFYGRIPLAALGKSVR